jgi:hypothetical protein
MDVNRRFRPFLLGGALFLILVIIPPDGYSREREAGSEGLSWLIRGSLLYFPEDNGLLSDSGPILPVLGAGLRYKLWGPLVLELSLDLYGYYYDYDYTLNRAVPAEPANRAAYVLGSLLGLPVVGSFDLGERMTLRVYGGPAVDLRLCLLADGLGEGEIDSKGGKPLSALVNDIAGYFWREGRWFLPVAGIGFDYRLFSRIGLGFDARVWFPAYKTWTGEDLPRVEGWRFGAGFTVTIG